jgi:hypothetical protein
VLTRAEKAPPRPRGHGFKTLALVRMTVRCMAPAELSCARLSIRLASVPMPHLIELQTVRPLLFLLLPMPTWTRVKAEDVYFFEFELAMYMRARTC